MSRSSSAGSSSPNAVVPPPRRPPAEPQGALGSWMIAIATLAAVVAVGAFALQRRAAERDKTASAEQQTDTQAAERSAAAPARASAPAAAASVRPVAAVQKPPKKSTTKQAKIITVPTAPAAPAAAASESREAERPAPVRAEPEPSAPAPTPAAAETTTADAVIITGCLEMSASDDRYRLTDTEGDNAPKARSWRTGFLKRRSASVDLVGVSSPRSLERQVGKKVAATGVLTDRALKVSSVRVVSSSCE